MGPGVLHIPQCPGHPPPRECSGPDVSSTKGKGDPELTKNAQHPQPAIPTMRNIAQKTQALEGDRPIMAQLCVAAIPEAMWGDG